MELNFRDLRADEIECRVAQITKNGLSLLLYKDARCDMNILDETVGALNWKREHCRDNANCIVSIWDFDKSMWISKEDTGTESMTEKEKGLASDSFKRACFNWGIGRELYTAPFIWVRATDFNMSTGANGKPACRDKFTVKVMECENKVITRLVIRNETLKKDVYSFGLVNRGTGSKARTALDELRSFTIEHKILLSDVGKEFGFGKDTGEADYKRVLGVLKERFGE